MVRSISFSSLLAALENALAELIAVTLAVDGLVAVETAMTYSLVSTFLRRWGGCFRLAVYLPSLHIDKKIKQCLANPSLELSI